MKTFTVYSKGKKINIKGDYFDLHGGNIRIIVNNVVVAIFPKNSIILSPEAEIVFLDILDGYL